jgi:hypothetical protein
VVARAHQRVELSLRNEPLGGIADGIDQQHGSDIADRGQERVSHQRAESRRARPMIADFPTADFAHLAPGHG